jgi:hypothetical protein
MYREAIRLLGHLDSRAPPSQSHSASSTSIDSRQGPAKSAPLQWAPAKCFTPSETICRDAAAHIHAQQDGQLLACASHMSAMHWCFPTGSLAQRSAHLSPVACRSAPADLRLCLTIYPTLRTQRPFIRCSPSQAALSSKAFLQKLQLPQDIRTQR